MQMNMYVGIELFGQISDALQARVAHRIWSVWRKEKTNSRTVYPCVPRGQSLTQVVIDVGRIRRWEIDDRHANLRAHAKCIIGARARVGVEVEVIDASDSAAKHFGAAEQGPFIDERV